MYEVVFPCSSVKKRGEAKGRAEGKVEGIIEMARAMKAEGEPFDKIAKYTQLSTEEIQKL